jgi:type VII secretion protein EccE
MTTTRGTAAEVRPPAASPDPARPAAATTYPARLPTQGSLAGLRLAQVVSWEVAAAAGVAAWHYDSKPVLYAVAGAAGVLLVCTLSRRQKRWLYHWLGLRLAYRRRRRPVPLPADDQRLGAVRALLPAFAVESVTGRRGQPIGVLRDGAGWAAVLDLTADTGLLALPGPAATVQLGPLITALSTEDIQLSAVQFVVHTVPAGAGLPPALQVGWLALRVGAQTALSAAGRSAGTGKAGLDRVQRTLRRGVDRAVETLHGLGVDAHPLDEEGLRATFALSLAARPATAARPAAAAEPAAELWTAWQAAGAAHSCLAVHDWPATEPATGPVIEPATGPVIEPATGQTSGLGALLGALATVPAQAVTLALTVPLGRPVPALTGTVRITAATADGAREAAGLADQAATAAGARLLPLDGQQAAAVVSTLPLGVGR